MSQVSKYPLKDDVAQTIDTLFTDALARMHDRHLVTDFMSEFLTPSENIMLQKRFAIYVLLAKGYHYDMIKAVLHVSTGTISQASKSYKYLGKGVKKVVADMVKDDKFNAALLKIGERIAREFGSVGGAGSAGWRAVASELHRVRTRKPL